MAVLPRVEVQLVLFEFKISGELTLEALADALSSLDQLVLLLAPLEEDTFARPEPNVVSVEMHSPLRIVLALAKAPKEAVDAMITLCKRVIFYEETRRRMAAEAELEWEQVRRKRLEFVKEALEVAHGFDPKDVEAASALLKAVDGLAPLETSKGKPTLARVERPR